MRQAPTTAYEDRCVRLASVANNLVAVWRDPPNRARADALRALQRSLHAAHPYVHVIHVVNAGATSPLSLSEQDRDEMLGAIRALRGTPSVVAIGFEGPAFFVASWRSILSTAVLLIRPDFPIKIVGSRQDAAAFVHRSSRAASKPSVDDLLGWVAAVERGLLSP